MKVRFLLSMLAIAVGGAQQAASQALPPPPLPAFMNEPSWKGQSLFGQGRVVELDALILDLTKTKARSVDGRFQLYMLTKSLADWFELWDERHDESFAAQFEEWRQKIPQSSVEPVVEAMQIDAMAWRARGRGYSSTVADEGWRLFNERTEKAWRFLMEHKKESSSIPTWYEVALTVGDDADKPDDELRALFEEGIRKFPGYHPIYFSYTRHFSPRWGGNYESADEFIRKQVTAKTNPEGEVLYARLYWLIDQYTGAPQDFFEASLVSWPRMRAGFELLMKQYPDSKWNQANFAMFACRARDAVTYTKLRTSVDAGEAQSAGGGSYSLEVCDARFMKSI
jgi:hypothetical protein